jgi:hypothetical protein
MCVDAAGENFEKYAMENCFYFAPDSLKPTMLMMIQRAIAHSNNNYGTQENGIEAMCLDLTKMTASAMSNSMRPYFAMQLLANEQIASSVDSLIQFLDPNAGKCMDFESNPYATVLMPEPVDYFSACGRTTMCSLKCEADFTAFDTALAEFANAKAPLAPPSVKTSQQESRFFVDANEDAYTPMIILTMVELSDCTRVCGPGDSSIGIPDTCIAIAGISGNQSVSVKKYCIPRAMSIGVWSQPIESWGIWYSEGWSDTLLDLSFTDTVFGDVLLAYRDNRGGFPADGPRAQFISIHPRFIQADDGAGGGILGSQYAAGSQYSGALFDSHYSTEQDRSERLTLLSGINPERLIGGIDLTAKNVLALTDVKVIPTSGNNILTGRDPWILMTMIVVDKTGTNGSPLITDSTKVEVCGSISIELFVRTKGQDGFSPQVCDLGGILDLAMSAKYLFLHFPSFGSSNSVASLALIPTKPGYDMYSVQVPFIGSSSIGEVTKVNIKTPLSFTSNTKIPGSSGDWANMVARNSISFSNTKWGTSSGKPKMTQSGITAITRRIMSQNTLVPSDFLQVEGSQRIVTAFVTNDPDSPSHWLTQLRMTIQGGVGPSALLSDVRASLAVQVTVDVLHSCDHTSCLGCKNTRLIGLCNAARQCAVTRCIGTVVNQKFFLCDAGLSMQSLSNEAVALTLGAWLIFTETYSDILSLSLGGNKNNINVEWIDDAFFGYVCSAKDVYGQLTGIITAAVGSGIMYSSDQSRSSSIASDAGSSSVSNSYAASTTLVLNGINSFLYQLALFPLYPMIATQRAFVCSANSMLAIIGTSGFQVTLGRADLMEASSIAAGSCLSSLFESQIEGIGTPSSQEALVHGASQLLSSQQQHQSSVRDLGGKLTSQLASMQARLFLCVFF